MDKLCPSNHHVFSSQSVIRLKLALRDLVRRVGFVQLFAVWTCLHLACFLLDLAVEVILWSIFINQLFKFVDVLLIELDISFHIAQISAVALQLTISSSLKAFSFRCFSFDLLFVFRLLALKFLI